MRKALAGFGLVCLLAPGLPVAAEGVSVTAPASPGVCAAPTAPAPLALSGGVACTITVTCPGGSVVQCSARFVDECVELNTYPGFVPCGVYCSVPPAEKYCPGYNSSNCFGA